MCVWQDAVVVAFTICIGFRYWCHCSQIVAIHGHWVALQEFHICFWYFQGWQVSASSSFV